MRQVQGYEVEIARGRRQRVADLDTLRELLMAGTIDGSAVVVTPSGQHTTAAAALGVATAKSSADRAAFEGVFCLNCRALIPPGVSPCPNCGKDPQYRPPAPSIRQEQPEPYLCLADFKIIARGVWRRYPGFVLFAILAPMLIIGGMLQADGPSAPSSYMAYYQATEFAKERLKSPSTARFAGFSESRIFDQHDGTWVVKTHVDAQNSFGAMLRTNLDIVVRRHSDGAWSADEVNFLPR